MKRKIIILIVIVTLLAGYSVSFAQSPNSDTLDEGGLHNPQGSEVRCAVQIKTIGDVLCKLGVIMGSLIPFLIALGVVYFVWGVVQYVIASDEEAKKRGKSRVIYGIIGFAVILGLWGLVTILTNTFGIVQSAPNINLTSNLVQKNQSFNPSLCTLGNSPDFQVFVAFIVCILAKSIIPLIFALALVMFVWGVVQYVIGANEEKERAKGRQFMIWGIIALAVMVSVWGLVRVFSNTFKIDFGIPQVRQKY